MSTFALVHGAWHGGWCWERLTPELERRGHRAVPSTSRAEDPDALFDDYAALVVDALADMAATSSSSATRSAARRSRSSPRARPVRRLVFLAR